MERALEAVVVAVRVRPLADEETKENAYSVVQQLPDEPKVLTVAGKGFAFDHVFTEACEQVAVYEEAIKPAMEKLFAGFNCAVIAYGHTGTGKTYTIGTDPKKYEEESAGIISRAVEDVLNTQESGDLVEISFMEIYNEEVYDLLTTQAAKLHVQAFSAQSLTRINVKTVEEAIHQLEVGSSNRHTRATKLNAHSSRSHAIFSIYYHQKNADGHTRMSKLDLVDLAGSEGVRHTDSKGVALVEANKINHGLLNLRNVISILATNSKDYVPYRSSTLTTVLKDSLNRDSFVTMITCISPSSQDVAHAINTLRFAEQAKKVMSKPKVNQMVDKFKVANPQAFEGVAGMAAVIPPTPGPRNLYRQNQTPKLRQPFTQLHNISSANSSSYDPHDNLFKARMNTVAETPCNSTMLSISSISSSTRLGSPVMSEISSALSPLFRKHLAQFQEQIQENINSAILMSQKKPSTRSGSFDGQKELTSSPMMEDVVDRSVMKILSVTEHTERNLRNELKNLKAELMSFVEEEVQKVRQGDTTVREVEPRTKKLKPDPSLAGDDDKTQNMDDTMTSNNSESRTIVHVDKLAMRKSGPEPCTPDNTLSPHCMSALTTVRRTKTNVEQGTPSSDTTLRRSMRLSVRNTGNISLMQTVRRARKKAKTAVASSADQTVMEPVFSPTRTSTVRRSTRLSLKPRQVYRVMEPAFSPTRTSTVRRSTRLSLKPRQVYRDQLYDMPIMQRYTLKPVLAISPVQRGTSSKAKKTYQQKVLKLLNGSLKDLTQLATVGPKTAIIIYNYRLLNGCTFSSFEDLTRIPGLPKTYYGRFVKANNIF